MQPTESLEIIKLDKNNIEDEHICCSFSNKKCLEGYADKKAWLSERFSEGYVFRKLNVRGKVFIEYIPAENGWAPIEADGFMLINCFWVSGKYKGDGHGKALLADCLKDAEGMKGVAVITTKKKMPFASDKKFFIKNGFQVCDTAEPYFELLHKPFDKNCTPPKFKDCAKEGLCDNRDGITIYYTDACPFNDYYINTELTEMADKYNKKLNIVKISSKEQAQNHFVPYTNYSVFYNGRFVTHQILTKSNFEKFIS